MPQSMIFLNRLDFRIESAEFDLKSNSKSKQEDFVFESSFQLRRMDK